MTSPAAGGFDRVTRAYQALEYVAFGRDLERVRFRYLERLHACRHILVLGEGDGRCLAQLVRTAPHARIACVDASPAMLAAAERRLPAEARARVTFTRADLRDLPLPATHVDAIVTHFVLDCFTDAEVTALVGRVVAALAPGGQWLLGDFALPAGGWPRLRARVWLAGLYAFFRWRTGLSVRQLPDSEAALRRAGLVLTDATTFQAGLLRSTVYRLRPFTGD